MHILLTVLSSVVSFLLPQCQWYFVLGQTHLSVGNVYDDSCNVVDGLTTDGNPCTQPSGIFSCATRPDETVTFVGYKNSFTGLQ